MSAEDSYSEYARYAGPRCYECGSRGHTHLRCPGPADMVPDEPATVPPGAVLIDWRENQ